MERSSTIFRNARLLDGRSEEGEPDRWVRVSNGSIAEVGEHPISDPSAKVFDLRGKTLMPGLIDCHVHVVAAHANLGTNGLLPDALVALHAARIMENMLRRGFTTVRDAGGATYALVQALELGLIRGPRLIICGKALSQTGGHADFRGRYESGNEAAQERQLGALGRICDGVDACRRAARDEIRKGAEFIKIMANGGVSSPTDRIDFLGFSRSEIEAIVEEAGHVHTYVAAHLYTDEAIARAVECGVRSIEHANLIEPPTARLMKERGAFAVPTLAIFDANKREGLAAGIPPHAVEKVEHVLKRGSEALSILGEAGVPMAYGTDLTGAMHHNQSREFILRGEVLSAIEVIRSTTTVAAELLGMSGKIGTIAPGAHADLIVVDGDPLKDLSVLAGQGERIPLIMQAGHLIKNEL